MLDVYDWILSSEIRDHMRANYPLSIKEKIHIICGGFRSIEEKEATLQTLLDESGEERGQVEAMIRFYGLAMKELRKTGPEHLFVLPFTWASPRKSNSLFTCDAVFYSTYAELLEQAEDICTGPHLGASKWERINGKWEKVITFDVQRVDGVECTTRLWPSDEKEREWEIGKDTMELEICGDEFGRKRIRYPIPFMTGDLVKLDAPMFDEPLFGVMDNVVDLNGTRYMWLGYVDGDCLNTLALSYNLLDYDGGYRVIDWLHSAKPEELPEGEEILKEIGEYLSRQSRQDGAASDTGSEFLDIFGVENNRPFRRSAVIPFPELLVQVQEKHRRA